MDGQKRGYAGSPAGSWQWSNTEITALDGYFKGRVWGPYTGNTYGAEAWIRTTKDFKDGQDYLINFTWQPDFADSHYNIYYLQITDGYIPGNVIFHWQIDGEPGTTDLLWTQYTSGGSWIHGWGFENQTTPGKLNWSLEILSSGIARLYNAPNKGGTLIREESLDTTKPWYFRLMVNDGTSAGFGAGDAWFNLYDFSAEEISPEPPEPSWSFVHITDTHIGYTEEDENGKIIFDARDRFAAAINNILKQSPPPDFILVTGDIAERGCGFLGCPLSYKEFLLAVNKVIDHGIEVITVPGNHDYMGSCIINNLQCYSNSLSALDAYGYPWEHKGFYFIGFDTGDGLNFGRGITDTEWDDFMDSPVSSSNKPKVIFMHHPPLETKLGNWTFDSHWMDFLTYCDWANNHNVKLVLAGHTHENEILDIYSNSLPIGSTTYPQFIQTPSTGKQDESLGDDVPGYRVVNVNGSQVSPQQYTPYTDYMNNYVKASLHSPGTLHVYDSIGNHVGLVNGDEIEQGIEQSFYFYHYVVTTETNGDRVLPEKIIIFDPSDDYLYEVVGKENGIYRLVISSVEDGDEIVFEAIDIPTSPGAVHNYIINWDALSRGEEGVMVSIDKDRDGVYERVVFSDSVLTAEEFMKQPMKSFRIENAQIIWPSGMFAISGTFELPDGCQRTALEKYASLSIQIAGKEGKNEIALCEQGNIWFYRGIGYHYTPGQGININSININWPSKMPKYFSYYCNKKSTFSIKGQLSLEGVGINTQPREATVTLEIPLAPYKNACNVSGKETIVFQKLRYLPNWSYQGSIWGSNGAGDLAAGELIASDNEYTSDFNGSNELYDESEEWDMWINELLFDEDSISSREPIPNEPTQNKDTSASDNFWDEKPLYFDDYIGWEDLWFDETFYEDSDMLWEEPWLDEYPSFLERGVQDIWSGGTPFFERTPEPKYQLPDKPRWP